MRVLVAPDSFKGCLTAVQVADALGQGVRQGGGEPVLLPLADGGEGTLDVFLRRGFVCAAPGVAWDGVTAVVELAAICGMGRVPVAPMSATTEPLGHAVRAALDLRPRRLVIGLGGSASTDGGTGLIAGLGGRCLDRRGEPIRPGGAGLADLARLDLPRLPRDVEIVAATDVRSPLAGPDGAAHVFASQKGASPRQIDELDAGLRRLREVAGVPDLPGSGAAGGTGYAVQLLGGRIVSGADLVLDLVGFDAPCAAVDLVVTGEGRVDMQTDAGKVVAAVRARAARAGTALTDSARAARTDTASAAPPVVVVAGAGSGPDVVALDQLVGRSTAHDPAAAARALAVAGRVVISR